MTIQIPTPTRNQALILCIAYALLGTASAALSFRGDMNGGLRVFGSLWASGYAVSHGLNPYALQPLTWVTSFHVVDLNLNPPVLLPLFQFFAKYPPLSAARAWCVFSGMLFAASAIVLIRRPGHATQCIQIVWIGWAAAFADTLLLGQIYIPLFTLSVAAWCCLEDGRNIAAGVCVGILVAIKPNFGVWPLLLMLAGHWRVALTAVLTAASLTLVSLGVYGPETFQQWATAVAMDHHALVPTDVSIHGYLLRLGLARAADVVPGIFLLVVAAWVWRVRPSLLSASRLGIVTSLLASPLAWMHYTFVLYPALTSRPWKGRHLIAPALLSVPTIVPTSTVNQSAWLLAAGGSIYFVAVCLIFADFIRETHGPKASTTLSHVTRVQPDLVG